MVGIFARQENCLGLFIVLWWRGGRYSLACGSGSGSCSFFSGVGLEFWRRSLKHRRKVDVSTEVFLF